MLSIDLILTVMLLLGAAPTSVAQSVYYKVDTSGE